MALAACSRSFRVTIHDEANHGADSVNETGERPARVLGGFRAEGPLVAAFTLTTFLSALLLFSIQPLFAKMVLPVLGGSPSVWAVAMCFFQGALLAGYCWAHLLRRFASIRVAGMLHLALAALALLALPIALPAHWGEPPPGAPYRWQLGLFTVAVGLPFMAVAANAPLLQSWFAASGHKQARNPYFLYAASNLGSLLALLAFPFVLEPKFGLTALSRGWGIGFVALIGAIGLCYWLVRDAGGEADATLDMPDEPALPVTAIQRLKWVGLAFVPSALLTAFTTHVATDVASAPLIWVIPLAIYLLTFVLVFRDTALIPPQLLLLLHLAAVVTALFELARNAHHNWLISAGIGGAVFFTSAMVAHRTLYEARPDARHLTEFYLLMSLGGGLGGVFTGLIAPKLFSEVFEYPILLALTMFCRPQAFTADWKAERTHLHHLVFVCGITLVLFWLPWALEQLPAVGEDPKGFNRVLGVINDKRIDWGKAAAPAIVFAAFVLAMFHSARWQAMGALGMCAAVVLLPSSVRRGEAQRSFFGVYRVFESYDKQYNVLMHGTTLHGAQRMRSEEGDPVADQTPGTYYHPESPMAKTIELVRAALPETGAAAGRYGVVGLGAGSLSCYSRDGETWRFFEIDPTVVGIARNPEKFTYLQTCQPRADIVIGDARLTLAKEAAASFDLIIVDAFSSDAVPMHLMTAEALRLYASKLTPTGVVLLHISNRYLDLDSVLAATLPLVPELLGVLVSDDEGGGGYARSASTVAVFSKAAATVDTYRVLPHQDFKPNTVKAWTDDASDIIGPFLSKRR
jgi:hypothetical protein